MMELTGTQFIWFIGMSVSGGLLGWLHRRRGRSKSFDYALDAICTGVFVSFFCMEIARHFSDNTKLSIMIGGACSYYSDYVLELGKKVLARKSEGI